MSTPTLPITSHTFSEVESSSSIQENTQDTQASRGKRLSDEEKIAIFNGCLELQQEWSNNAIKKEAFWRTVSEKATSAIGRPYYWSSCRRIVTAEVL
jgi:hypothetical protein